MPERTTDNEYNVVQFFPDGTSEYVLRNAGPREAVVTARSYTERPAAQIGVIARVIITDGGDCTVFEWKHGEGVTIPTRRDGATFPGAKP